MSPASRASSSSAIRLWWGSTMYDDFSTLSGSVMSGPRDEHEHQDDADYAGGQKECPAAEQVERESAADESADARSRAEAAGQTLYGALVPGPGRLGEEGYDAGPHESVPDRQERRSDVNRRGRCRREEGEGRGERFWPWSRPDRPKRISKAFGWNAFSAISSSTPRARKTFIPFGLI